MNRILPRLGLAFLALLVLLIAALVCARLLFDRYLHSDAFLSTLDQGAADTLHASHAEFSPLQFDGSLVYGENFRATRDDGGGFSTINADQLRATFDWHGLLHHTVQVDEVSIQRLDIESPTPGQQFPESAEPLPVAPAPMVAPHPGWGVDLKKAEISEANWHWTGNPEGGLTGAAVTLTPDGSNAWIIAAEGGTLVTAGVPDLTLDEASMRWQSPTLYITNATLHNGSSHLTVTGSVETRQAADLRVSLEGADVQPLLTPDWRQRLTGNVAGIVNIHVPLGSPDPAQSVTLSGSLAMLDAQLTALPILDQIGLFTHTERFRQLQLTRAEADFTHAADRLEVRNMVVESEGLIRVEGAFTVIDGRIDGTFQIGLTPATLQWIPGSQDDIFVDSHGGYRWTAMRLTGPAEHPIDDLTPRLIAAAANSVLPAAKDIEGTVKKAGESVLDMLLH